MSRHDIAVLTLRAFALYAWFTALEFFASGAMTVFFLSISFRMQGGLTFGRALATFGPSVLFIVVGVFLFVRSRELASWLLPPPTDAVAEQLPPHPLPVASVAFAVVGVAIFLYAAPRAISDGITFSSIDDPAIRAGRWSTEFPRVIANAAQIVLGFLLFLNARTFATAWWRKQQPELTKPV
jgi:hypothetical protein